MANVPQTKPMQWRARSLAVSLITKTDLAVFMLV